MQKRERLIEFLNKPSIIGYAAVGGNDEKQGPLGGDFDYIFTDQLAGKESWEQAESELQKTAVNLAIKKANINNEDIGAIFAGDLLNQCVGSTFGLMDYKIPLVGLYGACSTMALSMIVSTTFVDGGYLDNAVAVTSSHFCSAERQFRFPLEYAGQRPPTSQKTVTASGAVVVSKSKSNVIINRALIGKTVDFGIKDANNMGAAMAPDDVKIRPYPLGYDVRDLDLFSVVISALAVLKMLEMQ